MLHNNAFVRHIFASICSQSVFWLLIFLNSLYIFRFINSNGRVWYMVSESYFFIWQCMLGIFSSDTQRHYSSFSVH